MDDRAEFEQWAHGVSLMTMPNGDRYAYSDTEIAWQAWQARGARQRERDLMIGLAEIATSTGPTGGWLDSPKGVAAGFTEAIRRQP